jgi:putative hemolysin
MPNLRHIQLWNFPEEERRIPESGPLILVSNCPLGGQEAELLQRLIAKRRSDCKVLPLPNNQIIADIHFTPKNDLSECQLLSTAIDYTKQGGALLLFPAKKGGFYNKQKNRIDDHPWCSDILESIKTNQLSVCPIWIQVKRKAWINLFKRGKNQPISSKDVIGLQVRIGLPISKADYRDFNPQEFAAWMQRNTALLSRALAPHVAKSPIKLYKRKPLAKEINAPLAQEKIKADIEKLRADGKLYVSSGAYEVFLADWKDIPSIGHELGRLREITFRQVGEGTLQATDLDAYDRIYKHLVCWNSDANEIVGAYRLALGKEIAELYGLRGFYVPSLFKIKGEAKNIFYEGIEMGRAFIVPAYQQKPLPLFLLWKGIIQVWLKNPEHKYLVGCVSISNQYSPFSRSLMITYIKEYHFDEEMAAFISPRNPVPEDPDNDELKSICKEISSDIRRLDTLISSVEPQGLKVPVLVKKYIRQNAKIAAFNIDHRFNQSLDGLMYIDMEEMPAEMLESLTTVK